jgi:uncharacterized RDD family membrane protein YckC
MQSRPKRLPWPMTVLASFVRSRPRPAYEPADGTYRASAAPLWRRGVASLIDWTLVTVLYLIGNIALGMPLAVAREIGGVTETIVFVATQIAGLAIVVAFFAFFLSTGHTLGMRALDIHVVGFASGREPTLVAAVARSLLAVVFFLASFTAYSYIFGRYDPGLSTFEESTRSVAITVATIAFFGHVWKLADPAGRSIWDRLTGFTVIEDMVPATMPDRLWSPWGP